MSSIGKQFVSFDYGQTYTVSGLPGVSPSAPIPISATVSSDYHTLTVTFNKTLREGEINPNSWRWQIDFEKFQAGIATVTDNQVVAFWNGFIEFKVTPAWSCSYSALSSDLLSFTGVPVVEFEFPLETP